MMRVAFFLALGLALASAAVTDCTYDCTASQADDNDLAYEYCNLQSQEVTTDALDSPSQLTVTVAGSHGECVVLASDLDDVQLEAQLGLKTRPLFKGEFETDDAGDITFTLNQYGDSGCQFVQRHIELEWGTDLCTDAQDTSQGIVHDMYFNDLARCNAFAALTDAERSNQFSNGFSGYADDLIDVWALASPLVDRFNFSVESKVLSRSFTQDAEFTKETSLCYGIGDTFAPPYLIPVLTENDDNTTYTVHNKVHAPQPTTGYLCSYDCSADVNAALAVFESEMDGVVPSEVSIRAATGAALGAMAASPCGQAYQLNVGEFDEAKQLTASLLISTGEARPCGVCQVPYPYVLSGGFSVFDLFGRLGSVSNNTLPDAAARYTMCQPGDVMSSRFFTKPTNDFTTARADCSAEATSPASAVSMTFALVASLFVAMR